MGSFIRNEKKRIHLGERHWDDEKAVIFDLDGTLANTIESLTYCGNRALRKFGLPEIRRGGL